MGFFKMDQPYGKFVQYDIQGRLIKDIGIYDGEKNLIKSVVFDSFKKNVEMKDYIYLTKDDSVSFHSQLIPIVETERDD